MRFTVWSWVYCSQLCKVTWIIVFDHLILTLSSRVSAVMMMPGSRSSSQYFLHSEQWAWCLNMIIFNILLHFIKWVDIRDCSVLKYLWWPSSLTNHKTKFKLCQTWCLCFLYSHPQWWRGPWPEQWSRGWGCTRTCQRCQLLSSPPPDWSRTCPLHLTPAPHQSSLHQETWQSSSGWWWVVTLKSFYATGLTLSPLLHIK